MRACHTPFVANDEETLEGVDKKKSDTLKL